jgi:hypothetical protein
MSLDNLNNEESQDTTAADGAEGGGDEGTGAELATTLSGGDGGGFVLDSGNKKSVATGTLILAGLLAACAGGTYLMYVKSGPKVAAASSEVQAADQTISTFLSKDRDNIKQMKDLLHTTQKAVAQFLAESGKKQVPIEELQTNPFRLKLPKPAEPTEDETAAAARKLKAEEEKKAHEVANGLHLQSIMRGRRNSCMINNTLLTQGQQIDGFVVEAINQGSVVLVRGEVRVEKKIDK